MLATVCPKEVFELGGPTPFDSLLRVRFYLRIVRTASFLNKAFDSLDQLKDLLLPLAISSIWAASHLVVLVILLRSIWTCQSTSLLLNKVGGSQHWCKETSELSQYQRLKGRSVFLTCYKYDSFQLSCVLVRVRALSTIDAPTSLLLYEQDMSNMLSPS